MNLVASLRSIYGANILLILTYLANWQFIVSFGAIIAIVLLLLKEKRKLTFLIVGVGAGELIYQTLKLLLHRARPDIGFSLIFREGYSFPSGHATVSVIFYGMICYGLFRIIKKWWLKILLVTATLTLVFFIGFSRIYLGVHWVSDVLGGWTLGTTILILLITFFEQQERFKPEIKAKSILSKKLIVATAIFLLIFEVIFFYYFYTSHPSVEPKSNQLQTIVIPPSTDLQSVVLSDNFPKFSETIVGDKMEPISFVIVGSKEQIVQVFQKAGWFISGDPHDLNNLYHLAVSAIFNQPYPAAPITPSFLNTQPNTIGFEKPTATNTVRQRHHTRFWLTNFQLNGTPIWVATASFDDGLRYFITHKIHPDIDTERDLINNDLIGTGLVKDQKKIQLVNPLMGKNQSGDQFFTDGKAYLIFTK
jgi:undecaprenyl-diphosphatase